MRSSPCRRPTAVTSLTTSVRPHPRRVRLVRHVAPNGRVRVLMTNLLDTQRFPAPAFGELYHQRWRIEVAFERLKHRLNLEHDSGLSHQAVLQDFAAKILCDNLEAVITRAAQNEHPIAQDRRINRACAHTVLKPLLPALLLGHAIAELLQQAMGLIVRRTFKHREGPVETAQSTAKAAQVHGVQTMLSCGGLTWVDCLKGLKVAIQGVGNVGYRLAKYLKQSGAQVWAADIYDDQVRRAVTELGVTPVSVDQIFGLAVDVFAPCALGSALNDGTLPQLRAEVVAGSANNQLAEERHNKELMTRGILYAPDYAINAGCLIDVSYEHFGYDRDKLVKHIEGIYDTLMEIFERARSGQLPTGMVADHIAEEQFRIS